jgi:hypothetical protein
MNKPIALEPTDRTRRAMPSVYLFRAAVVHLKARMANEAVPERLCKTLYHNDPVTPLVRRRRH